jgi:hypothetical protein
MSNDNAESTGRQFASYAIGNALQMGSAAAARQAVHDFMCDSDATLSESDRYVMYGLLDVLLDVIVGE